MFRSLWPCVLLMWVVSVNAAAEYRSPTTEEFREQVRHLNDPGRFPGRAKIPQQRQLPRGADEYQRAVALHTNKKATPADLKEAASLYQTACDAGIPQAAVNLALLYLGGKGVKKDPKKAITLLNSASKKHVPQADMALASLYLSGKEVKRDEKKGEWHLSRAAKSGNHDAVQMLADYREWKKKNEVAMKEYQELLKQARSSKPNLQFANGAQLPSGIIPQPQATYPNPPLKPELPIPAIPGYRYVGAVP